MLVALTSPAASSPPASSADARFLACAPYTEEIAEAVSTWWPLFDYPLAWQAQLYQESLCDAGAVSPVGARGLAQFMPGTWREVAGQLAIPAASPHDELAIEAGAFYMARLTGIWTARRDPHERHRLAQASYNAGAGNILRAQSTCARHEEPHHLWGEIRECLPGVTGRHARETINYVRLIEEHWQGMGGCAPGAAPRDLQDEWGCE